MQYLNNYTEIELVFKNLKSITSKKSKILFTQNPDLSKKRHLKTYQKLRWKKSRISKSLIDEEKDFD